MATIIGTNNSETINSLSGVTNADDTIFGLGGNDVIFGFGGDDWIKGGGGADEIYGGPGTDTASYYDSPQGVTVSLIAYAGFHGDAEGDKLYGIENLVGSNHDDTLWGDDGVNALAGYDGKDTLKGFGGADNLYGG